MTALRRPTGPTELEAALSDRTLYAGMAWITGAVFALESLTTGDPLVLTVLAVLLLATLRLWAEARAELRRLRPSPPTVHPLDCQAGPSWAHRSPPPQENR